MKPRSEFFQGEIRELDGLRGIAILLVLVHHFWPGGETPLGRFGPIAHLGWMGVDLFFVISGFLICGILLDTAQDPHYFRNFYMRRCLRIFPLYYVFLIGVFTLIPLFQTGASYMQKEFLLESGNPLWYFLYVSNIREAITGQYPAYFLGPLWSLAIEEQFYITFPQIVRRLDRRKLWWVLWGLVVAAPLFRAWAVAAIPEHNRVPYLATLSRVDVIALGCLIAVGLRLGRIQAAARWPRHILLAALAALVALFLAGGMDRRTATCKILGYSLTGFLFFAAVLVAVLNRKTAGLAILRWRPLTYMGKICYGTYLLHLPTEVFLGKALARFGMAPGDGLWYVAVKIAATVAVATVSWRLFENPILKLKKRFESSSHPQRIAEATTTLRA